jgi:hypothetical protein
MYRVTQLVSTSALVGIAFPAAILAQSGTTTLPATAELPAALGNATLAPSATLPFGVTLADGTGRVLTVTNVSGTTGCAVGITGFSADGLNASGNPCVGPENVSSLNKISGLTTNGRSMVLAGVFLGNTLPSSTPPTLSYGSGSTQLSFGASSYGPFQLGQVFFIGDGLTGTSLGTGSGGGSVQQFVVPDNATQLFFGFVDAANFVGTPGTYNDNSGSLTLTFNIAAGGTVPSTVPEPSSLALLGTGLVGLVPAVRRRRSK